MRLRTLLTLTTGAAAGASATYLFDPDLGPERRRLARRNAIRQARVAGLRALKDARRHAGGIAVAAAEGYRHGQSAPVTAASDPAPRSSSGHRAGSAPG